MNKLYLAILVIFLFSPTIFAACLEGHPSIPIEFAKSPHIIIGEVTQVDAVSERGNYYDGHNYTVRIIETIKGNLKSIIFIFSENSSGRFPMRVGESYILFLYEEVNTLQVDNCGNSGLLTKKQDVVKEVRNLSIQKLK
jgi:hypothetical protein